MSTALANPYVGPRPFSAAEAERFFGREPEANQLLSLVVAERLTLFYAQSGAGKSSLLQARLRPHLEQAGLIVLPTGRVSGDLPPGVNRVANIFAFNLMLSLAQGQGDPNSFAGVSLSHFLARLTSDDGHSYYYDAQASPAAVNPDEATAAYVLLIDQFEEIITTHPESWPERADFFRQLDQAMADDPLLRVTLTLREDYVAALDSYSALLAGKLRARFYMQRMATTAALEAVTQPAALAGRPFAPGVAESLVDNLRQLRSQTQLIPTADVAPVATLEDSGGQRSTVGGRTLGQFVEPVQLQVVCYQLWENLKDRPPGPITLEDLETVGNVDKALADFYEQALAKTLAQLTPPLEGEGSQSPPLSSQERGLGGEVSELHLRTWFDRQLITEAGTRGTVYQGAKETAGLPNAAVKLLADQFLLRAEIRAGGTWYELVHDRFVEPIQQANRVWREERLRQNPLIQAAYAWAEAGRPADKLYRDEQLANALAGLDRHNQEPVVQEFLTAGEEAQQQRDLSAERQRTEWLRRTLVIIGGVLLLAILAAIYGFYGQYEAQYSAATAQAERAVAVAAEATARAAQAKVEQLSRPIRSRQLAAESASQLKDNRYEVALPLAIEANRATETLEANLALRQALQHPSRTLNIFSGHTGWFRQASWNKDETKALTAGCDEADNSRSCKAGTAGIWDAVTGEELLSLTGHTGWVYQASWNKDETKVLTAGCDEVDNSGSCKAGTARIWDAATGEELLSLTGHTSWVTQASWNKDETKVLTVGCDEVGNSGSCKAGTAQIWDAATGEELLSLTGHTGWFRQASWNKDETKVLTAGCDEVDNSGSCKAGTAGIWDAVTGEELLSLTGHTNGVWQASWNKDETKVLTAGCDEVDNSGSCKAGTARIWDAATGEELLTLTGHTNGVAQASWNKDETKVLTAGCDEVDNSGSCKAGTARIWDAVTGEELLPLTGHTDGVTQASWNKDETKVLTASHDGTARIWDAATGEELARLTGHTNWVNQASWNQDETKVLTASADYTARIWDAATGEELARLTGQADWVNQASWNQDETKILTANEDGTVRLYYARLADLLKLACERAPRNLTQAEWAQFIKDEPYRATCENLPIEE